VYQRLARRTVPAFGRFVVLDEMQSYRPQLGELHSVHRPSKPRLWPMLALCTPLLMVAALCTLLILDSFTGVFTGSKEGTLDDVSNYFICMGGVVLLLALLGSIAVSDYREWSATRTVKLTIYQEGFTYESQGRIEACRWDEIEKIKFKWIEVRTKAFRTRVKVIRSIVKKDGIVINLAETLNLRKITEIITTAKNKVALQKIRPQEAGRDEVAPGTE
jgi:hypothetical protein